jgi:pyruvate dehydrogenase (quinone)
MTMIVSLPEQMPRILEIAIHTALARRSVAAVVLPGAEDVAGSPTVMQLKIPGF